MLLLAAAAIALEGAGKYEPYGHAMLPPDKPRLPPPAQNAFEGQRSGVVVAPTERKYPGFSKHELMLTLETALVVLDPVGQGEHRAAAALSLKKPNPHGEHAAEELANSPAAQAAGKLPSDAQM
jgi:hypothetical protein